METIDDILNTIGVGKFNVILLIILGCYFFIYALQTIIIALLGPILSCYWKLNAFDIYIFTTSALFGMSVGGTIMGYLADKYGRKELLILSNCGLIYGGIMCAISPTFYWITITQFLVSFMASGLIVSIYSLLTEFSPMKYRGTLLVSLQGFWGLGCLWITFLSYLIIPTFGWRILLLISTLNVFLFSLFCVYVPQSPRYLLLQNQKAKCIEVINHVAKMNGSDPINDLNESPPVQSSLSDLIRSNFLSTTILTSIMSFTACLTLYSLIFLTTNISNITHRCLQNRLEYSQLNQMQVNNTIDDSCCFNLTWKNYENMFISISAEILFVPLTMVLIDLVGRKKTLAIYSIINAVGIFLLNFCLNSYSINAILFFSRGSASSNFGICLLYASEVYPTYVRSFGIGICSTSSRIGGILAALNLVIILKFSFLLVTMLLVALNLLAFILSFVLPYETKGRNLMESGSNNRTDSVNTNLNETNYKTFQN